ncbi:MAG: cupin domain-containing protein [Planctomycetota bacterium]|nr:cupin domain-containing protein [Planctomycetota bacterium]
MSQFEPPRFVTEQEMQVEELPWGAHDWLCRPELTGGDNLLLVRVHMPPGQAHRFHRHPEMDEIIYVLAGTAEQWVGHEKRFLTAGQIAHIPQDVVHGTYNPGTELLEFLAILSPARCDGPVLIDMCQEEPWKSLRP